MLSVVRLVSFWRCIPVQYNCQKSSNFQGLSHFSRIFGKNDKIPGFFQAGKTVTIFPGFPGAVGTLWIDLMRDTLMILVPDKVSPFVLGFIAYLVCYGLVLNCTPKLTGMWANKNCTTISAPAAACLCKV